MQHVYSIFQENILPLYELHPYVWTSIQNRKNSLFMCRKYLKWNDDRYGS